jgi:hypothetical protein
MLILLHSLYDPLGILIPFCITGKLLVQDCWQRGLLWKDNLPLNQETAWIKWQAQIEELSAIEIPRVLIPGEKPESTNAQLHIFVNVSQNVYSAVAYMRTESVLGVALRFVQAKSRLKPIKPAVTIPSMELLAAEMGSALAKKLVTVLNVRHQAIWLWTDSRAVHDWLRVESRALQVFVKNRVLKIREYLKLTPVLWVPGPMNPADVATRGITVAKLKETITE